MENTLKRKIIGICGFIGSGKGTVADTLVNEYGYTKLSFADTLKDGVAAVFNWDRKLLEGDTKDSRDWRETPDTFWTT
jgi:adenylate kinase family enzyme